MNFSTTIDSGIVLMNFKLNDCFNVNRYLLILYIRILQTPLFHHTRHSIENFSYLQILDRCICDLCDYTGCTLLNPPALVIPLNFSGKHKRSISKFPCVLIKCNEVQ